MFTLKDEQTSITKLFIFMSIAYIFAIGMRFFWVNEMSAVPQFHWNNELMINTNDGYLFAEGARDLLAGKHQENDLSGLGTSVAQLTALLSNILPISFETLILYMPSFLGSLIVIPLILIGRLFNQTSIGFVAALLGSVAHSYYNRTMTGYYDTDMLNIVFPVTIIYFILLALVYQRNRFLIPITIAVALYQWWYEQAYSLNTAILAMVIIYTLIYERKNIYFYKTVLFILIGLLSIPLMSKMAIALVLFGFFHWLKEFSQKLVWPLLGLVTFIYFFTGGFDPIWLRLKIYLFTQEGENTVATSLQFYNVMSTVREAGHIPFTLFAERISGHTITFVLSLIGYVIALFIYRPLLITLPLAGLGFIALAAGLRFTIYAVPVLAFGFAYLLFWMTQNIQKPWLRYVVLSVFTSVALYPNYLHIREYMTPTVMMDKEIKSLEELKNISSRNDYVVAWWDYGYPIRYYADLKTWIDGGKHTGDVNYPASFVLTAQDQLSAAHMMRLFTEYTELGYRDRHKTKNDFEYMLEKEGFGDPDEFLTSLALPEYQLPQKTANVYLYLPLRMMDIFPTITLFSQLDLKTGGQLQQPFYYMTQNVQQTPESLELGNGVSIIKKTNILRVGNQEVPLKAFYEVGYDQNQKLQTKEQVFATEGLNVIYLASYGRFLVLDDFYLNSTYFQMFVFEKYDRTLFELVVSDPMTKIYRLKK